jgi:hypothetical protein
MLGIARGYICSIKEPAYGIKPPFVELVRVARYTKHPVAKGAEMDDKKEGKWR